MTTSDAPAEAIFDPRWLRLRADADGRARTPGPAAAFAERLPATPRLLDLGAGTGANLRHLAPRLGRAVQHWTLVDRDRGTLEAVAREMAQWAARTPGVALARDGRSVAGEGWRAAFATRELDLSGGLGADGLGELDLAAFDGVVGTALLDLVSVDWIRRLVDALVRAGLPVLFTLTVDGRTTWMPADPDDAGVLAGMAMHQGRDKGFGPALGARAAQAFAARLRDAGFRVLCVRSDWRLGATDRDLLRTLAGFHADACAAALPEAATRTAAWLERRTRAAEAGRLRARIGHLDVAAWPRD
ncbi:MAG TPA: class I SAM-dependent methyltransferase [Arenibaculum sp.]|nr:class I SAM-dependent methyltransferase [Arenibaculum sp.]